MSLWSRPAPTEARRRQFEELSQQHGDSFLRAALRLTGSPAEAEDLCQETLIKAYVAFEQFTAGSNFRAWVLRIMANTHISRYRHTQRTPATVSWEDLGGGPTRPPFDPPSPDMNPAQQALEFTLSEEPGEALAALPEEFRVAVILSDIFELSYKEIATLLSVPLGTVRSRIFRGRKLLQESLREYAKERRLI
jgi:RNA polymerase sigma-70 factor (ECF subfamily)